MSDGSPVRIACVGDSITWGFLILRRKRDCYPAQLRQLLGDDVVVGNFGINGHTLQESGDFPYRISKPYRESVEFDPDFVLIMLGTNDSRSNNWKGAPLFLEDYRTLVGHYRELPSAPRIFVMTPPAVYGRGRAGKVMYGMDAAAIEEMCAAVRELAREEEIGLIDVHAATSGHPEAFRCDGVHPSAAGAALIAEAVHDVIAPELAPS
jgi:lysophospholipase L1-like esterase